MKRAIGISLGIMMVLTAAKVGAHPPSDIKVDYDQEAKMLHLEMRHTTHDPREDYIRKIVINLPGQDPVVKRFNIQTNTLKFSTDVAIDAKPGTAVTIEAFSKEGGTQTIVYTIPRDADDKDDQMKNNDDRRMSREKNKGSGT